MVVSEELRFYDPYGDGIDYVTFLQLSNRKQEEIIEKFDYTDALKTYFKEHNDVHEVYVLNGKVHTVRRYGDNPAAREEIEKGTNRIGMVFCRPAEEVS